MKHYVYLKVVLIFNSIWNHLVNLSSVHGRTIIITTHYIEEARQAHTVQLNIVVLIAI